MKMTIKKKTYVAPEAELCENFCQPFMINIGSGETTPEESDANNSFFEDVEEGKDHSFNVWDEM